MIQTKKFRHSPNYKQFLCLELLYDRVTKYILFGGAAGGGKSWLGCEWIAAMCLNFPGVRYFIGREELKSLKETTVKTFFKMAAFHGISDTFRYYEHYSSIKFNNGSEISLLELKYIPSDQLFERFGSTEYTGGFIEEAGEVHFGAFDTLKARVGRQLNEKYDIPKKILITCNPKKNWLYHTFYKPWLNKVLEIGYAFIQALAHENEKIDKGYVEGLDEIKDKNLKARLKYGEWEYEDDPNALVSFDNIMNIFTNSFVQPTGQRCITVDVARFGKDKIIIRVWDGGVVLKRKEASKLAITETAELIKAHEREYKVPRSNVVIDEDGVGGGVVDILKGCKGFVANSSPLKGENYDNLKSQCGFKIADMIEKNGIYEEQPDLGARELLTEELEQLKQKAVDNDRKLGLIPKDKIKAFINRSPDDLDTYIMKGYWELIKPKSTGLNMSFHR